MVQTFNIVYDIYVGEYISIHISQWFNHSTKSSTKVRLIRCLGVVWGF